MLNISDLPGSSSPLKTAIQYNALPGIDLPENVREYLLTNWFSDQPAAPAAGGIGAWLEAHSTAVYLGAAALVALVLLRGRR